MFLFCKSSLFGFYSPLSRISNKNLKKAIEMLKNNEVNLLYIAINGFDFDDEESTRVRLHKIIGALEEEVAKKIYVAFTSRNFEGNFVQYLSRMDGELEILFLEGFFGRHSLISYINQAIQMQPGTAYPYHKFPVVSYL
jgi:hypothetical protein